MERGLALVQWIVIVLGFVAATILGRARSSDSSADWFQYLAFPTGLWLMLVPLVYVAFCEMVRRRGSSGALKTMQASGVALLVALVLLYTWLIFDL